MFRFLIFGFFLLAMVSANTFAAEAFFPMKDGDFWHYRSTDGQHEFRIRVSTPVISGGKAYFSLRGYTAGDTRAFVREEPGRGLYVSDLDNETEKLLTSFNPVTQPDFPADLRPCGTVLGTVLAPRDSLLLPSGYWQNTLRIQYQTANCGDPSVESEVYAPGIGMVQRRYRIGNETREFNLIYARADPVMVIAGRSVVTGLQFHLPSQGDDRLRFTLLSMGASGNQPVLRFDTEQRFDLILRDSASSKIWQYSDGKSFLPAPQSITGHAAFDAEIPLDKLPRKSIAPGEYTVEMWVTTVSGGARLSATARIFVPDFGQPPLNSEAINRMEKRRGVPLPLPGRPRPF